VESAVVALGPDLPEAVELLVLVDTVLMHRPRIPGWCPSLEDFGAPRRHLLVPSSGGFRIVRDAP
jgi:hypothetical protein